MWRCEYQHPTETRTFYAPEMEPSMDLAVPVLHVSGLENFAIPKPRVKSRPLDKDAKPAPNAGSGFAGTYMANDFRAAYVRGRPLPARGKRRDCSSWRVTRQRHRLLRVRKPGLPSVTLSNVLLDGFDGLPRARGGSRGVHGHRMCHRHGAGLSKIIVYEGGTTGNWHNVLNRMATDNLAKQLSCSWYIPGGAADTVADQIFQQMAAQGQSFFNASGDDDAYCGLIDFPGDTPYITQVGGTTLSTAAPGGSWTSERVWNENDGYTGGGGGVSTQYPIPTWQVGLDMTANRGSTTMRNVPDVAMVADQVYIRAYGYDQVGGGTSASAPLWAGFTALVNEQAAHNARPTVGFLNPALYAIGRSSGYASAFHDITLGNNTNNNCGPAHYPALSGFDLATGWGTPAGTGLINALAGPPLHQINLDNITRSQNGQVRLNISGWPGDVYRVLVSGDLLGWRTLGSVTNLTGVVPFTDTGATSNRLFYRCVIP